MAVGDVQQQLADELLAKALLVDLKALRDAQAPDDLMMAEQTLRGAFFADTRPLIGHIRQQMGLEADAHRASGYEARVAKQRTEKYGAPGEASYA